MRQNIHEGPLADFIKDKVGGSVKKMGRDAVDSMTSSGKSRIQGRRDIENRVRILNRDWNRYCGQHDIKSGKPSVRDFLEFFHYAYGIDASGALSQVEAKGSGGEDENPFRPHGNTAKYDFGNKANQEQRSTGSGSVGLDRADQADSQDDAEAADPAVAAATKDRNYHNTLMNGLLNNLKAGTQDKAKFNQGQAATFIRMLFKQASTSSAEEKARINKFFSLLKQHGPYVGVYPKIKDIAVNESLARRTPMLTESSALDRTLTPKEVQAVFLTLVRQHLRNPAAFAQATKGGGSMSGQSSGGARAGSAQGSTQGQSSEKPERRASNTHSAIDLDLLRTNLASVNVRMSQFDKIRRMMVDETPEDALELIGDKIPDDFAKRMFSALMRSLKPV